MVLECYFCWRNINCGGWCSEQFNGWNSVGLIKEITSIKLKFFGSIFSSFFDLTRQQPQWLKNEAEIPKTGVPLVAIWGLFNPHKPPNFTQTLPLGYTGKLLVWLFDLLVCWPESHRFSLQWDQWKGYELLLSAMANLKMDAITFVITCDMPDFTHFF